MWEAFYLSALGVVGAGALVIIVAAGNEYIDFVASENRFTCQTTFDAAAKAAGRKPEAAASLKIEVAQEDNCKVHAGNVVLQWNPRAY